MNLLKTTGSVIAAAALSLTLHSTAMAQHAAADVLFDSGLKLMDAGEYEEAAKKLQESNELDPAPGTALNLAECYVRLGRTASAWSAYRSAAALAAGRGQHARQKFAEDQVAQLEPRLSTIVIQVSEENHADDLIITRDGKPIPSGLLGQALPVDPGPVHLEASAPERKPWTLDLDIKSESASRTVLVPVLPPAEDTAQPAPPTTSAAPPAPVAPAQPVPPVEDEPQLDSTDGAPWLGYTALGLGTVLTATGVVFYLNGQSTIEDANCPSDVCVRGVGDPERYDNGRGQERTGVILGGIGVAAAATGLFLVLSSGGEEMDSPAVAATALPGGGMLGASGRF